jgi:hypothetical protein
MSSAPIEHQLADDILPPYRRLGMSPSDYIDVVQAERDRMLKQAGGDPLKAISLAFARMREEGLITESDLSRLEKVSGAIIGVEQGKLPADEVVPQLHMLYLEALADPGASSTGATIIGVSYSSRTNKTASLAGLMGMVIGGLITGGAGGALVGGLVGWAAGGGCKA